MAHVQLANTTKAALPLLAERGHAFQRQPSRPLSALHADHLPAMVWTTLHSSRHPSPFPFPRSKEAALARTERSTTPRIFHTLLTSR